MIVWLHIILLLQKLLPPRYLLNIGGLYESGFALNKGYQTLWTVPICVYEIDILTVWVVILYTHANLLNKRFWIRIEYHFEPRNDVCYVASRVPLYMYEWQVDRITFKAILLQLFTTFCNKHSMAAWTGMMPLHAYTTISICLYITARMCAQK